MTVLRVNIDGGDALDLHFEFDDKEYGRRFLRMWAKIYTNGDLNYVKENRQYTVPTAARQSEDEFVDWVMRQVARLDRGTPHFNSVDEWRQHRGTMYDGLGRAPQPQPNNGDRMGLRQFIMNAPLANGTPLTLQQLEDALSLTWTVPRRRGQ